MEMCTVSFGLPCKGVSVTLPVIFSCYKLQLNAMPRRDAFAFAEARSRNLARVRFAVLSSPPQRGWMQAALQPALL